MSNDVHRTHRVGIHPKDDADCIATSNVIVAIDTGEIAFGQL